VVEAQSKQEWLIELVTDDNIDADDDGLELQFP
jgi:hypothetical protein